MNAPRTQYDVIIAGGGMVGTSLALALATLDLDIAVVEPVERRAPGQPSFDDRSTALSRSSQRMFTALGLWDEIVAASTPIRHVHVSDKGRFGFAHIDADEQGVEALGYVVINRVLGGVLQAALDREKRAKLICPARIVSAGAVRDPATVVVERSDGSQSELSARLLVAADGARSSVRDMLGIGSEFVDYGQKAIIGNLMTGKAHENRAFERFTEEGPIAMLPIRDERTAFVWILPTDRADDVDGRPRLIVCYHPTRSPWLMPLEAIFGWVKHQVLGDRIFETISTLQSGPRGQCGPRPAPGCRTGIQPGATRRCCAGRLHRRRYGRGQLRSRRQ